MLNKRRNRRFLTNPNQCNYLNKRGQVTIFIIIALVIVAAVIGYFILRDTLKTAGVPASMEPLYNTFLMCLEEDTYLGIGIVESQGGYIELPDFEPGSAHMPFSSQFSFLGNPVPYWYYVSGNNIQGEQVPSKGDIEEQLGNFLETRIQDCVLDSYLESGFGVSMEEEVEASVDIREDEVEVNLKMNIAIERAEESVVVSNHNVIVKSKLGKLYEQARAIYEYEQDTLFLENYGIDILRLYAPVDGVELTCSPMVWNAEDVFNDLEEAIETNTLALKVEGGEYELQDRDSRYFVVDIPDVDDNVLFLNSRNWSRSFEVNPTQEGVMMAKPMGNQPGMGVLGFCYVPYHFVYNINYPVLVQVYSGEEIFQFPLAVIIRGNKPREALDVSAIEIPEIELCEYKNTLMEINTYDSTLEPVAANISFECFGEVCMIGETSGINGSLIEMFPQCVNGFVTAKADGYANARVNVNSTAQSTYVDIIMNKEYTKTIQLKLDNTDYNKDAIITFISDTSSQTVIYPGQKEIDLSEGQYEVQVYIYANASIRLEEQIHEECTEVPTGGLGALFGITEEKCFDVVIPAQTIQHSLRGGGTQQYYIVESELQGSTIIDINADSLPTPTTIEDLQKNYIEFEGSDLDIYFR